MMAPKNALISSFFAPKGESQSQQRHDEQPRASASTSSTAAATSSNGTNGAAHAPKRLAEQDVAPKSTAKTRRLNDDVAQSAATLAASSGKKLDAWRFDKKAALHAIASHRGDEQADDATSLSQGSGPPRSAEQEERHAAFAKRLLGTLDAHAEARRARLLQDDGMAGRDGDDSMGAYKDSDDEESSEPATESMQAIAAFSAKGTASATDRTKSLMDPSIKYTPLEKQYFELRGTHPGIMLCIEVGYKFKFYGDDARIASRELNVACFQEKHLMTAMVPVHRLHIHVKKLIAAGHKVGIVRQVETRALKAASSNASKPFTRKMQELYTSSTWIDDIADAERDAGSQSSPRSLVAIVEQRGGGTNAGEERVDIGLIAVQATTGTIVYDSFADGSMRSELETRLAHLDPVELILPRTLSKQTEKLLRHIASQSTGTGTAIRVERVEEMMNYKDAFEYVKAFYVEQGSIEFNKREKEQIDADKILPVVAALPQLAISALAIAIAHMAQFKLESIYRIAVNFNSFASQTEMLLTSNTLSNLEILENNTDFTEKGSLMWLLGSGCQTAMGKRMLRRWISRPLTAREKIAERSDGVRSLAQGGDTHHVAKLTSLLRGLPDLERGLARLNYGRATPNELATIMLSLNRATSEYDDERALDTSASIVSRAIMVLPRGRKVVKDTLAGLSLKHARENDKRNLFVDPDKYPELQDTKELIDVVDSEMLEHLIEVRKIVKNPRLQYATVAQEEHLIEVPRESKAPIPAEWLRINSTKRMLRYRSPTVMRLMKDRERLTETLDAQANSAFQSFLRQICDEHYSMLRDIVQGLATLDALLSLSIVANLPGYTQAEILDDESSDALQLEGFRHPMSEALNEAQYIANDLDLGDASHDSARAILLTGSNMGGKSSTVRAVALAVIMAQAGSYVPATRARLTLHDAVLTRMGASDQLAKGRSTMMIEVQETAEILRTASSRSLVILDELGRGTSTHDGAALAHAVLVHLLSRARHLQPMVLFITHFRTLAILCDKLPLRGMHMAYIDHGDNDITFLYKLRNGLAEKSFGIHCARIAGLSGDILELAAIKAEELERKSMQQSVLRSRSRTLQAAKAVFGPAAAAVDVELVRLVGHVVGVDM